MVRDELAQIVASEDAARHLSRLASLGLLFRILPELETGWEQALRSLDKAERLLGLLSVCFAPDDAHENAIVETFSTIRARLVEHFARFLSDERDRALICRMAALFVGAATSIAHLECQPGSSALWQGHEGVILQQADQAALALQRLRFSKREALLLSEEITAFGQFQTLACQDAVDARSCYRFFARHGSSGLDILCLAIVAGWAADLPHRDRARWSKWLDAAHLLVSYYAQEWPRILALPRLISGNDLLCRLKLKPGPLLGELLEKVREAQAVGEIGSAEEALAWASAQICAGTGDSANF